jgi:hypothetical protein
MVMIVLFCGFKFEAVECSFDRCFFAVICKTLVSTRIISPNWNASEFASMRHMYQKSFVCLMEAALQSVEKVSMLFYDLI